MMNDFYLKIKEIPSLLCYGFPGDFLDISEDRY